MIPMQFALRRRLMVSGGAPFAFEYTGNYTDNRDANGIGTVEFTTSGTLTVLSGKATVLAYILAGGGGAAVSVRGGLYPDYAAAGGGGGGNQTVEVELSPNSYDIVIGVGGSGAKQTLKLTYANPGTNTTAFGYTSTGGGRGEAQQTENYIYYAKGGVGGSPNGGTGSAVPNSRNPSAPGGSPNGGSATTEGNSGGNGIVRLTFS